MITTLTFHQRVYRADHLHSKRLVEYVPWTRTYWLRHTDYNQAMISTVQRSRITPNVELDPSDTLVTPLLTECILDNQVVWPRRTG